MKEKTANFGNKLNKIMSQNEITPQTPSEFDISEGTRQVDFNSLRQICKKQVDSDEHLSNLLNESPNINDICPKVNDIRSSNMLSP